MARKVQDYVGMLQHTDSINKMVVQLSDVCTQACKELEIEFNRIKSLN